MLILFHDQKQKKKVPLTNFTSIFGIKIKTEKEENSFSSFLAPFGKCRNLRCMFSCSEIWKSLECSFFLVKKMCGFCNGENFLGRWMRIFFLIFLIFLFSVVEKHVCFIMLLYYRVDFFSLLNWAFGRRILNILECNKRRLRKYRFSCKRETFVASFFLLNLNFVLIRWVNEWKLN